MARTKIAKSGQNVEALENEEWEGERDSVIYARYRSTVTSKGTVTCGEGSMVFGGDGSHLVCLSGSTVYAEAGSTFEAFPGSKVFAEAGSSGVIHPGSNVINRGGTLKAPAK